MSSLANLFREEAAAARNERQRLDLVLRAASPHEKAVRVIAVLALAAFVLWGIFGGIHRYFAVDDFLSTHGNQSLHDVGMPASGAIAELPVSRSDKVVAAEKTPGLLDLPEGISDQRHLQCNTMFHS